MLKSTDEADPLKYFSQGVEGDHGIVDWSLVGSRGKVGDDVDAISHSERDLEVEHQLIKLQEVGQEASEQGRIF